MDNELYVKNDGNVKYWTREQLQARAEAAEKRLAELEAENELLTYEIGHEIVERNRYLANLAAAAECTPDDNEFPDALTDRIVNAITDLRTKLAAQGWQPVTDKPKKDDMYINILISGYWRNGLFRLRSGDEIWDRHVLGWQYGVEDARDTPV